MTTPPRTAAPHVRAHRPWHPVVAVGAIALLAACSAGTPQAPTTSTTPAASAQASGSATPTATATVAPAPPATSAGPVAPQAPTAAPTTQAPAAVDVVVTFAGWNAGTSSLEVGAYAATLAPGTCTLRLSGPGGATVQVDVATVADAATVSCDGLAVPGAQLSSGSWSGVVEYTSAYASGRAQVDPMEIP